MLHPVIDPRGGFDLAPRGPLNGYSGFQTWPCQPLEEAGHDTWVKAHQISELLLANALVGKVCCELFHGPTVAHYAYNCKGPSCTMCICLILPQVAQC